MLITLISYQEQKLIPFETCLTQPCVIGVRLSVLSAIVSTQQKLKLYSKVPPNGLVVYCGTILTAENKEKKVNIDFEPFKPINTSLYLCDNKFHTEVIKRGS